MSFHVGVHALILGKNNKVLVTKRSSTENYMPLLWDFPGGSVAMGETVEQTLLREVHEETGLSVSLDKPIFVHTDLSWVLNTQLIQIVYKCLYIDDDVSLNPEEHDEYLWIDYNEILKLMCTPFLENLLKNYILDVVD